MTRPSSASTPEDLFDAIAKRLPADQRAIFYERMLYFRHLRPEDELLRIAEAMGFLALVIRDAPHDLAIERERLAELFTTSLAALRAAGDATRQYHESLDARVTRVAADIGQEINAPAIAQAITENIRQQFVRSGLPDTADALAVVAKQLKHSVGEFQRTANQLNDDYAGAVRAANHATTVMLGQVSHATDRACAAVDAFQKKFSLDYLWALGTLGTAARRCEWLRDRALEGCRGPGRAAGRHGTGAGGRALIVSRAPRETATTSTGPRSPPSVVNAAAARSRRRALSWNRRGTRLEQ